MSHLTGQEKANYVQGMFARIASRYDVMNRLMTFGQDGRWRQALLKQAQLPAGGHLLDLGTGTGDIALAAFERDSNARIVGGDFTEAMMRVGQKRPHGTAIRWSATDALNLPFPDNTFDAVTSGYLMRNVMDVKRAWAEQYRVLKPGGRVVCLDTTPPPRNLLYPFIQIHLHVVIPTLGKIIAGNSDAYTYLPDSTENFLAAEPLAERMRTAGFREVAFQRLMLGTMALHWGVK